jgi:hypothetical protein
MTASVDAGNRLAIDGKSARAAAPTSDSPTATATQIRRDFTTI